MGCSPPVRLGRYPFKLFLLLARPPGTRCSDRQQIAKDVLATQDEELECNTRKLKVQCRYDFEFLAEQGRFDLQQDGGSKLFAVVSTMAELLKGDTQLVESINSIIRLIGTRCPSIDLETMSARVTVKKAAKGELAEAGALAKRWSSILRFAKPLLLDMVAAGAGYKEVMSDAARFEQPPCRNMASLDIALCNKDITKALPDLKKSSSRQWASAQARVLKKALEQARQESKRMQAYTPLKPGSLTIVCVRPVSNKNQQELFLQVGQYRSIVFMRKLEHLADGSLKVTPGTGIVSSLHLILSLRSQCFQKDAPETFETFCLSALHVKGRVLVLLPAHGAQSPAAMCSLKLIPLEEALPDEAATEIKKSKQSSRSTAELTAAESGVSALPALPDAALG